MAAVREERAAAARLAQAHELPISQARVRLAQGDASTAEAVLDLGLVILAVGIAWLAIWLFDRSRRIATGR